MLIDARTFEPGGDRDVSGDVCVVGGGVAGIVIARELASRGVDVVLLESGGLSSDADTDDLLVGESTGLAYDLGRHHRSRFLGGGSNCWAGWSRPLEPDDFQARAWVPESGWPITLEELAPHYDRACVVLGLGSTTFEAGYWEKQVERPWRELDDALLRTSFSRFAEVLRLGQAFREDLRTHPRITALLHATVTDLETDPSGSRVRAVTARTLNGRSVRVQAARVVVATGGVENARLLLAVGEHLAIDHDLVGRYFMDHPRRLSGEVRFRPGMRAMVYARDRSRAGVTDDAGVRAVGALVLAPEVRERLGLLNARAGMRTMHAGETSSTVEAMRRLRRLTRHRDGWSGDHAALLTEVLRHPARATTYLAGRAVPRGPLVRGVQLEIVVEPIPERDSRVTLSDERDALGLRRARVDWRLGDQVGHTFRRTAEVMADELARAGVADVDLRPVGEDWRDEVEGTWHHMGTTRMHASPRHGVVDVDCRVHGVDNLYVAGSSVFPTAGANFPTLTLTALALRLADHLVAAGRGGAV